MGLPVLIYGKSGSGKSTSLRNFETFVINVNNKSLPFRKKEGIVVTNCNEYAKIKTLLLKYIEKYPDRKSAVIDDSGYLMTEHFMRGHSGGKGNAIFELYNKLGDDFYDLIKFVIHQLPNDFIVYLVMHEDKNDLGDIKPKTIGRMLDEKVCIEGMFTIALRALKLDGKYLFATQTDGLDVTKTPLDMFDEEYIDNDLAVVDKTIREYYQF